MPRNSSILTVTLAWLFFFVLWSLYLMSYGFDASRAFRSGLWATATAALLSLGVWWLSGRLPWPDRLRPVFFGLHLLAGLLFIGAWTTFSYLRPALLAGRDLLEAIVQAQFLSWYLWMGLLLYAIVGSGCYAVRNQQRVREQERITTRAEALAAQATLQTLRAQLNPHFLFNALHSLSTLIRPDPARAEQAVEQLADLLRYALDEKDTDAVPLTDEWAFTRDYLALQRLRFDARLRVETDFEAGALACLVPPFTLQPLVENAVEHGIAPRLEGGTITIQARRQESDLILTVHDDGPGTEAGALQEAQGLGLRTLRERVQTRYGHRAGLTIETAPGAGFCATLTLPDTAPHSSAPGRHRIGACRMTCRVLIADDEPLARRKLRGFLAPVTWTDLVAEATDGPGARQAIDTLKPDLVFLDIRMPGASGLEVLQDVAHLPHIIFTTAYDTYAVAAFALQALDYLLKPFGEARFHQALDRARHALAHPPPAAVTLERVQHAFDRSPPEPITRLFVRTHSRIVPLPVDQIERLEAHDDYVMLYAGSQRHLVHIRMKDFEERLDHRFIRIHRSHIVNLDYITALASYDGRRFQVEMQGGTRIIASRAGSTVLRQLVL